MPRCFCRSSPLPCLTRVLTSLPAVLTSGLCYRAGALASEDRSSYTSARTFISDLMTNTWRLWSTAHLEVVWDLLGREEEDDELTVSLQGHCMGQSSPACTLNVHRVGWEKAWKRWKGLALAALPPCKGVSSLGQARPRYTKPWLQGLPGTGDTPTFPHKWTGFISHGCPLLPSLPQNG